MKIMTLMQVAAFSQVKGREGLDNFSPKSLLSSGSCTCGRSKWRTCSHPLLIQQLGDEYHRYNGPLPRVIFAAFEFEGCHGSGLALCCSMQRTQVQTFGSLDPRSGFGPSCKRSNLLCRLLRGLQRTGGKMPSGSSGSKSESVLPACLLRMSWRKSKVRRDPPRSAQEASAAFRIASITSGETQLIAC